MKGGIVDLQTGGAPFPEVESGTLHPDEFVCPVCGTWLNEIDAGRPENAYSCPECLTSQRPTRSEAAGVFEW